VGRRQDDWGVLQIAHAFEQAAGQQGRIPPL
jgi:Asp-tRNA(Asn)/Glu-tRNA(Gln) amidotransferase A subunit family amidase